MQKYLPIKDSLAEDKAVIMIIDDSPESLKLLTNILAGQGFGVRQALNGRMALDAIKQQLPDLIILDIRMPGMDGLEVCRQLKDDANTRTVPVIFISGLRESDDKVKAFEVGALDYITKPFQEAEVLARVKLHLALSKMKQNLEELVQRRTIKLEESNTALKVLLEHRQSEREKFEENVITHINSLVMPYLKRLKKSSLDHKQTALADVIESNLDEITSQFSGKLYAKAVGLTRREMEVAALIKTGKTNMEIADLLYISEHSISFHRQNLRKKLGLLGRKVNLVAYLNEITLK
ncbi:MAG: response regulator transcription factor [Deltaproteobacteria bacterium]|nr:response regulator transcription factor [Deltaproteobacteria bacterium]